MEDAVGQSHEMLLTFHSELISLFLVRYPKEHMQSTLCYPELTLRQIDANMRAKQKIQQKSIQNVSSFSSENIGAVYGKWVENHSTSHALHSFPILVGRGSGFTQDPA